MRSEPQQPVRVAHRLPGMDGFRAIAALAIVAFHCYLATSWATSGSPAGAEFLAKIPASVDGAFRNLTLRTNVFFVLSGMLLSLPFVRWLLIDEERRPRLRRFVMRRIRRIWPLYLLLMPLAAATVSINRTSVEQVVLNALLLQNVVPGGMYLLPPTWTLTVEIGFYVLLPITLVGSSLLIHRLRTLQARTCVLTAIALGGFVIASAVRRAPELSVAGVEPRVTALGYLDNFAAGMLASIIVVAALAGSGRLAARVRSLPPLAWTIPGTLLVTIGLVGRWHGLDGARTGASTWWWVAPVTLGIACWLLAVALRPDRSWLARVVASPLLTSIGQISYGIFLWHYIVLHWFGVAGVTRDGGLGAVALNILLVLGLTFPLAWASWHLIEEPMISGRVTLPRPRMLSGVTQLGARSARPLSLDEARGMRHVATGSAPHVAMAVTTQDPGGNA